MFRKVAVVSVSVFLCSCVADLDDDKLDGVGEISSIEQEVRGGTATSNYRSVVGLVMSRSDGSSSSCSGTLIGNSIILTAGHCFVTPAPIKINSVRAHFGSDFRLGANDPGLIASIPIASSRTHPSYRFENPQGGYDVALAVLTADAPASVPRMSYFVGNPEQLAGANLRLVGFGNNNATTGYGPKRTTVAPVRGITANHIQYGDSTKNTCGGDSGGPLLAGSSSGDIIVGVVSFGNADCTAASSASRMDKSDAFIRLGLAELDPARCDEDGRCAADCDAPDPDCPCAADGFCTEVCPDVEEDADCPLECLQDGVCVEEGCPTPDLDCEGASGDGDNQDDGDTGTAAGPGADGGSGSAGGCQSGGPAGGWSFLALLGLLAVRRRRSAPF